MRVPMSGLRIDNPAFPLLQAGISYWGQASGAGAVTGDSVVCADLANEPSYQGLTVKILTGDAAGQVRTINSYIAGTGTIWVSSPFTDNAGAAVQIVAGTSFAILSSGYGGGSSSGSPGLSYIGVVDGVPGANQFTINELIGKGDTFFQYHTAIVLWDAGGAGAAPQGEYETITAYTSATGTFTTAAYSAAVAVGDIILIINNSLMAAYTLQEDIWFDSREGEAGTAWPIGTPSHPVDNHNDLFTIMAANPTIRRIHISGALTLVNGDAPDQFVEFIGNSYYHTTLAIPAGVTIIGNIFRNLYVDTTGADSINYAVFVDCTLSGASIGTSALKNCQIEDLVVGTNAVWERIVCDDYSLDLSNITGSLNIYHFNGTIELTGLTAGTVSIFCEAGAQITIAASCTGGTINIYGQDAVVTDNSAGTVVNYDFLDEQILAWTNEQFIFHEVFISGTVAKNADTVIATLDAVGGGIYDIKAKLFLDDDVAATYTVKWQATRPNDLVTYTERVSPPPTVIINPATDIEINEVYGDLAEDLSLQLVVGQNNLGDATNAFDLVLTYWSRV